MSQIMHLPGTSGRWEDLYKVDSASRPGVSYVVARDVSGAWGCSCPAWVFHTPRKDCKHITAVRRQLMASVRMPTVSADAVARDVKLQKVLSRFALVEL